MKRERLISMFLSWAVTGSSELRARLKTAVLLPFISPVASSPLRGLSDFHYLLLRRIVAQ